MGFRDLREFLAFLEEKGQLRRIATPVSAELEITEIADRVVKAGGPALLFENVIDPDGRRYGPPVLINAFGTARRMAWSLGLENLDELGRSSRRSSTSSAARCRRASASSSGRCGPASACLGRAASRPRRPLSGGRPDRRRRVARLAAGPEVLAGGRRAASSRCRSSSAATRRPGSATSACTGCRSTTPKTTGMHWHRHKGGADHYREGERQGTRLEVAVAIGADPGDASTPRRRRCPPNLDEFLVAGFLRRPAARAGPVQDGRPRGAGRRRDRPRGLRRPGRAAAARVRSATTPATTRWPTTTRSSTSPR